MVVRFVGVGVGEGWKGDGMPCAYVLVLWDGCMWIYLRDDDGDDNDGHAWWVGLKVYPDERVCQDGNKVGLVCVANGNELTSMGLIFNTLLAFLILGSLATAVSILTEGLLRWRTYPIKYQYPSTNASTK